MIRYAKLSLPFNVEAAQQELLCVKQNWQQHFNTFYFKGSWTALALRAPGGDHQNIIPDLIGDHLYQDTVYMQEFPAVQSLLASLHCPVMAVRFLNLQAGSVINPHRDKELAFEKGEARLHFPVKTNPDVAFYMEDERIYLNEGECWYINANLPHSVANNGLTDRIHLVVDCKVNNWLSDVIAGAERVSVKNDNSQAELLKIISELKLQNTDTANQLAAQLQQQLK